MSLLDPFEVAVDGQPVDLPKGRQRALLTGLALKPSQVVAIETLVDQTWGDEPPRNPRNSLQVHVRRRSATT